MEAEVKKTSEEWSKGFHMIVRDPDGWDRANFDYSWYRELITEEEFNQRAFSSTLVPRGMSMALLYKKISEWAAGVFGVDREATAIVLKLRKEVNELEHIVRGVEKQWHPREEAYSEVADCVILLMNLADRLGLDYKGFSKVVQSKFEIIQERQWDKEADGTYQHRDGSSFDGAKFDEQGQTNKILSDEEFNSPENQNRDQAILGFKPVLPDPAHRCTICGVNWVDSDNGFDTCQECLNKM